MAPRCNESEDNRSRAANIPGIVKTTLDGVDQRAYLEGTSPKSARDTFFYYTGATPSAVRYKNWKMYYTMVPTGNPGAALLGAETFHWTQVDNIKRDPFEMATGVEQGTLLGQGGALAGPVTAYIYDWNLLPLGQLLWLKELETFQAFPPLQDPASYNLESGIRTAQEQRERSPEPVTCAILKTASQRRLESTRQPDIE